MLKQHQGQGSHPEIHHLKSRGAISDRGGAQERCLETPANPRPMKGPRTRASVLLTAWTRCSGILGQEVAVDQSCPLEGGEAEFLGALVPGCHSSLVCFHPKHSRGG